MYNCETHDALSSNGYHQRMKCATGSGKTEREKVNVRTKVQNIRTTIQPKMYIAHIVRCVIYLIRLVSNVCSPVSLLFVLSLHKHSKSVQCATSGKYMR